MIQQTETVIQHGDCLGILKKYPDNFFDFIITSPLRMPIVENQPMEGLLPESMSIGFFLGVINFSASSNRREHFILNIKERVVNGERSTYVLELILALRQQGVALD